MGSNRGGMESVPLMWRKILVGSCGGRGCATGRLSASGICMSGPAGMSALNAQGDKPAYPIKKYSIATSQELNSLPLPQRFGRRESTEIWDGLVLNALYCSGFQKGHAIQCYSTDKSLSLLLLHCTGTLVQCFGAMGIDLFYLKKVALSAYMLTLSNTLDL